ncbi:MAG: putative metal-dependent hydrolase, TIM-barrel fold [Acidimicrobiales bacterium]|nr:putative metal-dependent hydrolase, TIM-barrel fold [Acidimicrobiales bacterium]
MTATLSESETVSQEDLVSADSHVKMTHEQVKAHMPSALHEAYDNAASAYDARMSSGAGAVNRAGAVQKTTEQLEAEREAERQARTEQLIASNAVFGRAGYWDPAERLKDMDADGVRAEVLYSEVSAFRYLSTVRDGVGEAVRGFNDALHEFSSADPARLIVSYQIPIHDIDLAVAEVKRVAALGARSLQLPVFPAEVGEQDYFHVRYEPLFALIEEIGLPICLHIGLRLSLDELAQRDPTPQKGIMVTMTPLMTAEAFGMFVMGGVFERFPRLKVVFVEPGLTWVAWWLETVDDMVARQGYRFPAITERPSDYFRRNVHLTFIDEKLGLERMRDVLGVSQLMWSTDFPHPVTSWPNSRKVIDEQFANIPADERQMMVAGNAIRVWNL